MVASHVRALCAVVALVTLGGTLAARQEPAFKTGNRTVAVYATVANADGRFIPDLARDAFTIFDNGKPQPLTLFANDIQPITVVILLDRSGSMRAKFALVEEAAEQFVAAMLPSDKARIGSFSNRIQVDPRDFTSDHDELLKILRTELQEEGPTPLWNAVNVGITGSPAPTRPARHPCIHRRRGQPDELQQHEQLAEGRDEARRRRGRDDLRHRSRGTERTDRPRTVRRRLRPRRVRQRGIRAWRNRVTADPADMAAADRQTTESRTPDYPRSRRRRAAATSSSRRRTISPPRSDAWLTSCITSTPSASPRRCSTARCTRSRCGSPDASLIARARKSYLAQNER